MKTVINWFEIPATDLERAARFWEKVLATELKRESFLGTPHAIFGKDPSRGAVVQDEKLRPAGTGTRIYLDAPDLDGALGRVKAAGGEVVLGRTAIGPAGFIGLVKDTEGNVIGLHAPPG
jgi:predicted enzyme related to lactoylglutathione lyase